MAILLLAISFILLLIAIWKYWSASRCGNNHVEHGNKLSIGNLFLVFFIVFFGADMALLGNRDCMDHAAYTYVEDYHHKAHYDYMTHKYKKTIKNDRQIKSMLTDAQIISVTRLARAKHYILPLPNRPTAITKKQLREYSNVLKPLFSKRVSLNEQIRHDHKRLIKLRNQPHCGSPENLADDRSHLRLQSHHFLDSKSSFYYYNLRKMHYEFHKPYDHMLDNDSLLGLIKADIYANSAYR